MANVDFDKTKLFRFVASGSNNKLAMLVGVESSDCEKTLGHYLSHASVNIIEAPRALPNASSRMSGIDLFIKEKKAAPYYEICNRLKQNFFEHMLLDETKLRP